MSDTDRIRLERNLALMIGFILGNLCAMMLIYFTQPVSASAPAFDHSNCQYPERWSNPADGCDNSDPAVPECIKGITTKEAEEACIAEFVKQHEQPTAPVQPVQPAPAVPAPIVNDCEGK